MVSWWWVVVLLFPEVTGRAAMDRIENTPRKEDWNFAGATRAEDSPDHDPRVAIVIPDYYDQDSIDGIVRAVEKLQGFGSDSTEDHKRDQKRSNNEESHDVDKAIQEVFSPVDSRQDNVPLETKNPFIRGRHSLRYKIFILKNKIDTRRRLRKLFPHMIFKPLSILGSKQLQQDSENQGSSEEMLGHILGGNGKYLDSENGDESLNNAFLTKTTTYNLTKLEGHKNSFLFTRKENVSTYFDYLDSNERSKNYSASHSSSVQTVLGHEENEPQLPSDSSDREFKNSDKNLNEEVNPGDCLHGEGGISENDYHKRKFPNEPHKGPSDERTKIEAGNLGNGLKEYGYLDSTPKIKEDTSHDFVAGLYLGPPIVNCANKENGLVLKSAPSEFIGGQFVEKSGHETLKNSNNQQKAPSEFVGGQFTGEDDKKDAEILGQTNRANKNNPLTDFIGGQFVGTSQNKGNEENQNSLNVNGEIIPPEFVNGQYIGSTNDRENVTNELDQSNEEDKQNGPKEFVGGQFVGDLKKIEDINNEFETEETTEYTGASDITSMGITNQPRDYTGNANSARDEQKPSFISKIQRKENDDSSSIYEPKDNPKKGMSSNLDILSEDLQPSTEHFIEPETETESYLGGANINEQILGDTLSIESSTTSAEVISDKYSSTTATSKETPISNLLGGNNNYDQTFTIIPSAEKKVVFETIDDDTHVIVTVDDSTQEVIKDQEFIPGGSSEILENAGFAGTSERSAPSEEIDNHPPRENYENNEEDILEVPRINNKQSPFEQDPATNSYITERVGSYSPFNTIIPTKDGLPVNYDNFNDPESKNNIAFDDTIVGEYSDLQTSQLMNSSNELFPNESLFEEKHENSTEESTEVNDNSKVVDEVELFPGKNYTNDVNNLINSETTLHPELNETTTGEQMYNNKEYSKELCFPLANSKNISLYDLLSGDLYLEKEGKRIPLQLKENPMKTCNSGTNECKLFLDFKNTTRYASSERFNDDSHQDALEYKPKNGKRHITEEEMQFMKTRNINKISTKENELTQRNKTLTSTGTTEEGSNFLRDNFYDLIRKSLRGYPGIINKTQNFDSLDDASINKLTYYNLGANDSQTGSSTNMSLLNEKLLNYFHRSFNNRVEKKTKNKDSQQLTLDQLDFEKDSATDLNLNGYQHEHFGAFSKLRPARTININPKKRTTEAESGDGGQCGCKNLLQSASPTPSHEHFVTKRQEILKNIVHTVGNWMLAHP